MTINLDLKKRIAARIKALLAKTTEAGCTEAEAMAAAMKARALMDAYGLDADMVLQGEWGRSAVPRAKYRTIDIRNRLSNAVAEFCDCRSSYYSNPFGPMLHDLAHDKDGSVCFFGREHDRLFAVHLVEVLAGFVERQSDQYMRTMGYGDRGPLERRKSFALGCINRICSRLHEAARERSTLSVKYGDGRSLVAVKMTELDIAQKRMGLVPRNVSHSGSYARDGTAAHAGMRAGDGASFSRPIGGGGGTRLIGRSR